MRTMEELVDATNAAATNNQPRGTHSILLYGEPKTGKTTLAATLAMAPEIDRIFLFMLENGEDAIATAFKEGRLTREALRKIIVIKISDTREDFNGIQTLLKTVASKKAAWICDEHGIYECVTCKKANKDGTAFDHKSLTKRDVIIIDSLSQAGVSALNQACAGMPSEYKPGFDEYGACGKWLADLCTWIQAAPYCTIIAITHVLLLEDARDGKESKLYPLCGTKNFSMNVAKYFGTVIFLKKKMGKLTAISGVFENSRLLTGSRLGLLLEKQKELDLVAAMRDAGFLPATSKESPTEKVEEAAPAAPVARRFGK